MDPEPNIRWLTRPKRIKHHYSCDKCKTTHSNYISPDMITEGPLHRCRYTTEGGNKRDVWRELTLDS